jgi:predicted lipoprotein with Yx(FWY)xxD motif
MSVKAAFVARTQREISMLIRSFLAGAAALAFLTAPTLAQELAGGAVKAADIAGQTVLTDANGMTLYIFDKDSENLSNCYDQCAANWPPLLADDGAMADDAFSVVERTDGTSMWAYKGAPLYYWINDTQPGETTGDGVGGVWHLAVQ